MNHVARAAKHHAPPAGAEDTGAGGPPGHPPPLAYDRALELAKDIARWWVSQNCCQSERLLG